MRAIVFIFLMLLVSGCDMLELLLEDEPSPPKEQGQPISVPQQPVVANFGCVDIDGLNYYVSSYVIADNTGFHVDDSCLDSSRLAESYCNSDGKLAIGQVKCTVGCESGKCTYDPSGLLPTPESEFEKSSADYSCYDADGGTNYATKSYIILGNSGEKKEYDTCMSETKLQEWTCQKNGHFDAVLFTCKGLCVDGACVSEG